MFSYQARDTTDRDDESQIPANDDMSIQLSNLRWRLADGVKSVVSMRGKLIQNRKE